MAPEQDRQRLIIVSNRLPLSVKRQDGTFKSSLSSGGLVTSLSGLTKSTSFNWFGWPGIEVNDPKDREEVSKSLAEHNATSIFLDNQLANAHYNNFSNSILWPILHYQSGMIFEDGPWQAYRKVNELFADAVAKEATSGSLIWVHDYHLMLLPKMLRERLGRENKKCAIGFSLHTPFPAGDFWRALPVRRDLIEGMLASDLIGFHTDEYKQNFTGTCVGLLYVHFSWGTGLVGADMDRGAQTGVPGKIQYKDRLIEAGTFIVGIDPQKFNDALAKPEVQKRTKQLEERYRGVQVIIGVDRLDYIKGLTQKLKGYDRFLEQHPEFINKVVLIQVAVPSREDVKEYQDLETEICTIAGKINGKHATPEGAPLLYMHRSVPFDELTALYSVADACLLTSSRDGMNLVSFEYIACQAQRHGVLVLSEFAGASSFMREGTVNFHPANTVELADAIHQGLTMDPADKKRRLEHLSQFINVHTSAKWGETFIDRLSKRV